MLHNEADVIGDFRGEMEEEASLCTPTIISEHLQQTYNSPQFSLPWLTKKSPSLGLFLFCHQWRKTQNKGSRLCAVLTTTEIQRAKVGLIKNSPLHSAPADEVPSNTGPPSWTRCSSCLTWSSGFQFLVSMQNYFHNSLTFSQQNQGAHILWYYISPWVLNCSLCSWGWPCGALHGVQCPPHWAVSIHH